MNIAKKYQIEITLAWRNVLKNKRRTILTLLTIMVGCAMIIFMRSLQDGFYERIIEDAVAANTGHIQIHEKGYFENMSIDYAFQPSDRILQALRSNPSVAALSQRIHAAGLISSGNTTEGALIQGIDPEAEKKTSDFHKKILKSGRYFQPGDDRDIVMGEVLAKNLGVSVGSQISIISQAFDGSFAALNCNVIGMFRSGNPEYDRYLILIPLTQAVQSFSMNDFVNSIVIRLKDGTHMERVRDELHTLPAMKSLEIMGYDELLPDMMQYIIFDRVSGEILYWILFLVVAFGVLNTIQMSVYERIREFGVMLAIGTKPAQIRLMILIESFFIAIAGVLLGMILGFAISYYFFLYPMDYSSFSKEMAEFGFATLVMPAKLEWWNFITTMLTTLGFSLLFTIFPARRAASLKPIDAIRKL